MAVKAKLHGAGMLLTGERMSRNLKVFFDNVRGSVFGGSLSQGQVDGCQRIIEYRDEKWPLMNDAELAYVLATAEWETGHSLQPVEEGYPLSGAALKAYQKKLRYYPWYGRGLVQITWQKNYEKFGIVKPEDALTWEVALHVMFKGCAAGMFTGHKLADYITATRQDYVNARRVVNGTDQAEHIAKNARAFLSALLKAATAPVVEKPTPIAPAPKPVPAPAARPTWADRLREFLEKLAAQPAATAPLPKPAPIPAPPATPSPDLIAVAARIEQRQLEMLQMLADKFAAFDAKLDAIKARMDDLEAKLVAKDAEIAAAAGTLTPEQTAEIDALNAQVDAIGSKLDAMAS